jgi:hypothetical protein
VGEPLSRETLFPLLLSVAVMLITCTANEVTLASGASVPTTKLEPVVVWPSIVEAILEAILQPERIRVAMDRAATDGIILRPGLTRGMSDSPLSANSATCTG